MFHGGWFEPWFWLLGSLLMVGFWVLVVVVIVGLVRRAPSAGAGPSPSSGTALQVLEERYARGEVSREEFLERRAVLLGEARPEG